jgi:hypothetical protein
VQLKTLFVGTGVFEDGTEAARNLVKNKLVSDAESGHNTQGGKNYGSSTMVEQE